MPHPNLVGPFPAGANPDEYDHLRRRTFWLMPSGIYVLGSRAGARRNLMTTTWATQLAQEPKLLGVSVEREAVTHELIAAGRSFTLSIIDREDRTLVRKFVKPADVDPGGGTIAGVAFRDGRSTGAPVLTDALGYLECSLERSVELGSHTLFIGEVVDAYTRADFAEAHVLRTEDTRMQYGG